MTETLQLPSSLRDYGFVIGRVVEAIADTPDDVDRYPEAKPAQGTVKFTPDRQLEKVSDQDYPAFVVWQEWTFSLNELGEVKACLVSGVWTVSFNLISGGIIPPFPILVDATHTEARPLQLVDAAPPVPEPHITLMSVPVPPGGSTGDLLAKQSDGSLGWVPAAEGGVAELSDLTDVDVTQAVEGEVLTFDGMRWYGDPAPPPAEATADTMGVVALAGDLGGTASAPLVPSLADKANSVHGHDIDDISNAPNFTLIFENGLI